MINISHFSKESHVLLCDLEVKFTNAFSKIEKIYPRNLERFSGASIRSFQSIFKPKSNSL